MKNRQAEIRDGYAREDVHFADVSFDSVHASPEMMDFCISIVRGKRRCLFLKIVNEVRPMRGFRLVPDNMDTPLIVRMMRDAVFGDELVQKLLERQLAEGQGLLDFYNVAVLLGCDWVVANWRRLFRCLYDPRIAALSMLCCFRNDREGEARVQRLGGLLASCHGFWKDGPYEDRASYGVMTDAMRSPFEARPAQRPMEKPAADEAPQSDRDAEKIKGALQASQAREKELRARNRNLTSELEEAGEKLEAEKAAHKAAMEELRARLDKARDQLADEMEMNSVLSAQSITKASAKWLEEAYDAHGDCAKLAENAERMLREQDERNLKYGTLATLREDVKRLMALRQRLQESIRCSLNVNPGMDSMLRQIDQACMDMMKRLENEPEGAGLGIPADNAVVLRLMTAIRSLPMDSDVPAELEKIRGFIRHECFSRILSSNESSLLLRECERMYRLWRNATDTGAGDASRELPEIWDMRRYADRFGGAFIVIDGYNAMLRSQKHGSTGDGRTFGEQRNAFIAKCAEVLKPLFKGVWLVFDGIDDCRNDVTRDGGMAVIYARHGQDEHNADLYIAGLLKSFNHEGDVWLVTDDYGLRRSVEDHVTGYIPAHSLLRFMYCG